MDTESLYELYLSHPTVTTDSRRCPEGSMFFALRGESFDGNRFAAKALAEGCAIAVVDDAEVVVEGDSRYVLVPDVLQALQALAARHRRSFRGPVVQVTGTNGKTTTKELLAAVLGERYRVLYTQGNLNNHIGVPLTLLRLRPEDEVAIIETGANHPGEIALLTQIVQPDYGLVTNVGRAHLEGFGSFEGVKRTKGELYDYLIQKPSAHLFVNGSSQDLRAMLCERALDLTDDRCLVYGHDADAQPEWVCRGAVVACEPMLRFRWRGDDGDDHEVTTQLIGDYNIDNVLAAVAVGLHFGVAASDIDHALSSYHPSLGRSEYRRTAGNELIVDAYNANLTSMMAALDNFSRIEHTHKMVILGDMRELGKESEAAHRTVAAKAIGSAACRTDVQRAWFVGEHFETALQGMTPPAGTEVRCFKDVEAAKEAIRAEAPNGWLILIKGSNGTKLHQLPDEL